MNGKRLSANNLVDPSVVNLKKKPQQKQPKSSDANMNRSVRKSLLENELNKIGNINETRIRYIVPFNFILVLACF